MHKSSQQFRPPAYILAGGMNRRFGSDKGRASFDGRPVIVRLVEGIAHANHKLRIVADTERRYADLGYQSLADLRHGAGPLAGLESALAHQATNLIPGWILVTNCDLLYWNARWSEMLCAHSDDDCDAIMFQDERVQPLPGLFHTRILDLVRSLLETQRRSLRGLIEALSARVKFIASPELGPSSWTFNTPEEFQELGIQFQLRNGQGPGP